MGHVFIVHEMRGLGAKISAHKNMQPTAANKRKYDLASFKKVKGIAA